MSNLNERQFPLGHAYPRDSKGQSLMPTPDLDAPGHVTVQSYDHLKQVVAGKSAHRYDFDGGGFQNARVHHWDFHPANAHPESGFRYKAGSKDLAASEERF